MGHLYHKTRKHVKKKRSWTVRDVVKVCICGVSQFVRCQVNSCHTTVAKVCWNGFGGWYVGDCSNPLEEPVVTIQHNQLLENMVLKNVFATEQHHIIYVFETARCVSHFALEFLPLSENVRAIELVGNSNIHLANWKNNTTNKDTKQHRSHTGWSNNTCTRIDELCFMFNNQGITRVACGQAPFPINNR